MLEPRTRWCHVEQRNGHRRSGPGNEKKNCKEEIINVDRIRKILAQKEIHERGYKPHKGEIRKGLRRHGREDVKETDPLVVLMNVLF